MTNSVISVVCSDEDGHVHERLVRPHFGLFRLEWAEGVEFHLGHGDMLRLLRAHGFEVLDLIEPAAPSDAQPHPFYDYVPLQWARQWPSDEIWVAQKRR
jgi:hypothetical protein